MLIPVELIPEEIMMQHNLHEKNQKVKVFMWISKGIWALKEDRALANQQLQQHLKPYGFTPLKCMPGPWKHDATKTMFPLVVDDLGAKHISKNNSEHLAQALKDKYEVELN